MSRIARRISILLVVFALMAGLQAARVMASDDAKVEEGFVAFQKDWMQKLRTHGKYGEHTAQVAEAKEGAGMFSAEYDDLTEPTSFEVKKTDVKATPYVGVIHYEKRKYSCRAKTAEQAKLGPYEIASSSEVTEIFRYSNGKWVY